MPASQPPDLLPVLGLPPEHLVPLAVFAAYFAIIAALSLAAVRAAFGDKPPVAKGQEADEGRRAEDWWAGLFGWIAGLSFAHTWYHMIRYIAWSFTDFHARRDPFSVNPLPPLLAISTWLDETSLFKQAWAVVLQPGVSAWISEHVTTYTTTFWVLFVWLYVQPQTGVVGWKGKHWGLASGALVVLHGQLVAISVAAALFFAGCARRGLGRTQLSRRELLVPLHVWAPLLLSASLSALIPLTVNKPAFLTHLLAVHLLLFVPFLPLSSNTLAVNQVRAMLLLWLPVVPGAVLAHHGHPSPSVVLRAYASGNHALGSIGADAVCCAAGAGAWAVYRRNGWSNALVLGPGLYWFFGSALGFGLEI